MQFIFSPSWFALTDICIAAVSAFVALLLAAHIFKIFSFTQEMKHKYFSAAFLMICGAFVISAVTRFFSMYGLFAKHAQGLSFYTFNIVRSDTMFQAIGMLASRFLMLAGLLAIFYILMRNLDKKIFALNLFFAGLVTLFSITYYYAFYIATFAVCVLITYQLMYNYFQKPSGKTASLLAGFAIITLSQAAFVLGALESVYVQAGMLQLLGYTMLLATYIQLRR